MTFKIEEKKMLGSESLAIEGKMDGSGHSILVYDGKVQSCSAYLGKVSQCKEFFEMCLEVIERYEKLSS
jgi:hypothetical protein